jgi:hypothetical protein
MRTSNKFGLLAGASAAAIGLALVAAPAAAFDQVNWTWDANITEVITKDVNIDINLDPTGMVMLEGLQVSIGDVSATSNVSDIFNNQAGSGMSFESLEIPIVWDTAGGRPVLGEAYSTTNLSLAPGTGVVFLDPDGNEIGTDVVLNCIGGSVLATACTSLGTFSIAVELNGEIVPLDSLDATIELPEVLSTATAVGNNLSITGDTSVQLHQGQFTFGDGNVSFDDLGDIVAVLATYGVAAGLAGEGVNSNLVGAGTLGTAAILGILEKAEISADSTVNNILNASVDSAATAVGNNLSVTIEAEGDDRLLIGDAVQFSYANIAAMSDVSQGSVNNYTNLGMLDRPLVSSVATAVGNNLSINVSAPSVE